MPRLLHLRPRLCRCLRLGLCLLGACALLVACSAPRSQRRPVTGSTQPTVARPAADRVTAVRPLVQRAARRHGVAEDLVLAVIAVESSFRPDARSHVGARGLMQLMPRTAASIARHLQREDYDITDPEFNIEAGTYYLGYLIRRFGREDLALAAYNAGPSRIGRLARRGDALPSYSQRYITAVATSRRRFTASDLHDDVPVAEARAIDHDRAGLRALLREEFGERPDEALPAPVADPSAGDSGG